MKRSLYFRRRPPSSAVTYLTASATLREKSDDMKILLVLVVLFLSLNVWQRVLDNLTSRIGLELDSLTNSIIVAVILTAIVALLVMNSEAEPASSSEALTEGGALLEDPLLDEASLG